MRQARLSSGSGWSASDSVSGGRPSGPTGKVIQPAEGWPPASSGGCVAADGLEAEALQEPSLGDAADGGQAGYFAEPLKGGKIDLGGDVLASHVVQGASVWRWLR